MQDDTTIWHPKFPAWLNHQTVGMLALAFMLVGLLYSRAMLSIGMIGLTGNAVLSMHVGKHLKNWLSRPEMYLFALVFAAYFVSGLWSEDVQWWVNRSQMKLPFLLLPFAVLSIPRFTLRSYQLALLVLIGLTLLGCIQSLWLYWQDFHSITASYGEGRTMPTPIQHIRFSLLVAFSVFAGWELFNHGGPWMRPALRWGVLGIALFMVVYLHVLAVRSGLLGLYAGIIVLAIRQMALGFGRKPLLILVPLLVASCWLAYVKIPTLQKKIDYTLYSLYQMRNGAPIGELSDSYRIGSIAAGWQVSREHPLFGVGVGDIREACDAYYEVHYPELANKGTMPHNQYLFICAAMGIPLLLLFGLAILYPLWRERALPNGLLLAHTAIFTSSFLVEHTLETQIGMAVYFLPLLLYLRYKADGSYLM